MPVPDRVGFDANCFIYLLEAPDNDRARALRRAMGGISSIYASTLTIAEILVKPFGNDGRDAALQFLEVFQRIPNLILLEVDRDVAVLAAELRAQTRLKLPDAIHVATAIEAGAEAFLTNDTGLARADLPIPVLRLDDLL